MLYITFIDWYMLKPSLLPKDESHLIMKDVFNVLLNMVC